MKEYNGHRSWNAWNVALWIGNDEGLYNMAMECIKLTGAREDKRKLGKAARAFSRMLCDSRTPDGAVYNQLSIKLALEGLCE